MWESERVKVSEWERVHIHPCTWFRMLHTPTHYTSHTLCSSTADSGRSLMKLDVQGSDSNHSLTHTPPLQPRPRPLKSTIASVASSYHTFKSSKNRYNIKIKQISIFNVVNIHCSNNQGPWSCILKPTLKSDAFHKEEEEVDGNTVRVAVPHVVE